MPDIPIAGESVDATIATTTLLTAPASGSAKVRLQWGLRAAAAGTVDFTVYVGSAEVFASQVNSNAWCYTVATAGIGQNYGAVRNNDLTRLSDASAADNLRPLYQVAPLPQEYIVANAQTIRFVKTGTAPQLLSVRFQGVQST